MKKTTVKKIMSVTVMRHGRIIRYYYKTDGIISNQNLGPSFLDVRITDITLTPVICKCIVMDQLQNCGTDIGAMFFFLSMAAL